MKQCQRIIFSYKVIELTLVLVCHLLLTKCIYGDGLEGFLPSHLKDFDIPVDCLAWCCAFFPTKLPSSHCHPLRTELAFSLGKEIITLMLRNRYDLFSLGSPQSYGPTETQQLCAGYAY